MKVEEWPMQRFSEIWPIIETVVRRGDSYALPVDLDVDAARSLWSEPGRRTFVAVDEGRLLGTYYLRPNQPGPGSHIANAGFMTAPEARGRGVARAMCRHAIRTARETGFRAMQFNSVVANNAAAIHVWASEGFVTLARIPEAFRLPDLSFVDLLLMHRSLVGDGD